MNANVIRRTGAIPDCQRDWVPRVTGVHQNFLTNTAGPRHTRPSYLFLALSFTLPRPLSSIPQTQQAALERTGRPLLPSA